MTKKHRVGIYRNRMALSEEERVVLDTKLFDAANNYHTFENPEKTIKDLLEQGADPNFYKGNKTTTHILATAPENLLQLCLEYGGDLTKATKMDGLGEYGYLPLHILLCQGNIENAKIVLEHLKNYGELEFIMTAKTARYGYSFRVCASQGSERKELHQLLDEYNIPHNLPDSKMRTELAWSASFDDLDAVNHLRETGSLAIIYDKNGKAHKASNTPQLSTDARKILFNMEREEGLSMSKPEMALGK